MSNIEQGISNVEGMVSSFYIRNWTFDISNSKSPFPPLTLSPFHQN